MATTKQPSTKGMPPIMALKTIKEGMANSPRPNKALKIIGGITPKK